MFVNASQDSVSTVTDTIEVFEDKVYVEMVDYSNGETIETSKAFLYPTTIELDRFKWTKMFKVTYLADSVVYHGERLTFFQNKYWKREKFDNGHRTFVAYFNERNQELSIEEFKEGSTTRGPSGRAIQTHLIRERIKN